MLGPIADLVADHIAVPQRLKGNKVLLLQLLHYRERLAMEPGTEPLRQLFQGADPFAGVDGIADTINAAV